ncbi:hypothetical protein D1AOALGA4SA_2020 [Olavius algarvensis Delta 1 endosymbiont]|nr:hypothetical protein D1AOALGA4SA_2020 [Olavius algarvensis Delta 1 endosymbiont]
MSEKISFRCYWLLVNRYSAPADLKIEIVESLILYFYHQ